MYNVVMCGHCFLILAVDCCVNRVCWCFTTRGMCTVGQDEIVVILEHLPEEDTIPMDIFRHLYHVYEEAGKGSLLLSHYIYKVSGCCLSGFYIRWLYLFFIVFFVTKRFDKAETL